MARTVRAYIGLGANLGDPRANLERAVRALAALPGVTVAAVSPLYQTKPVGPIEQPDFLNAVVALDVPAGPDPETGALALLGALKQLERALGRQPREHWGPREIDLDLLLFGAHQIDLPDLKVPHPEIDLRLFVLAPLADLAAGLRLPGRDDTVARLRDKVAAEDPEAATEIAGWSADARRWPAG